MELQGFGYGSGGSSRAKSAVSRNLQTKNSIYFSYSLFPIFHLYQSRRKAEPTTSE